MNSGIAPWAAGVVASILALFGLALASAAEDMPFQLFGFALFLSGLAGVFGLITHHTRAPVPPAAAAGTEGETDDLTRPTREGDVLIAAIEEVRGDADPAADPAQDEVGPARAAPRRGYAPRQPAAMASRA